MLERLFPQQADDQLVVEDVFSTWLYTGNGSTQTITNGINLSGQGGLVWLKSRTNTSGGATSHALVDTVRGASSWLASEATSSASTNANLVTGFLTSGFSVGNAPYWGNENAIPYASWTFREAPNFFDVVTYTGNGSTQNIAHNLGVAPGVIIVKSTTNTYSWGVYHRSYPNGYLFLNTTNAGDTANAQNMWGNNSTVVAPTSSQFTVGSFGTVNANGETYVAYLFAHVTGSDGIIQCGSSNVSSGTFVNLGWEPQWILYKDTQNESDWRVVDNMRRWTVDETNNAQTILQLRPSNSAAESENSGVSLRPNGFVWNFSPGGATHIYVAIRRGPMRTPTLGTSVFAPVLQSPQSGGTVRTVGFPADFILGTARGGGINRLENTKLTGFASTSGASQNTPGMFTNTTGAESNQYPLFYNVWNTTARDGDYLYLSNNINYFFQRAPGFFDVVCYTGTGAVRTVNHNLGVVPELMIVKKRSAAGEWVVYAASVGNNRYLLLNATNAQSGVYSGTWNSTTPTSTVFSLGTDIDVNTSAATYVAYLFASVPGVSKVGSYTGNGSSQTINCAFTTGARFVLIKRTDSTGDWYVWDSARGIVAGNDPYLALNDTAAEVTTNDSVDTDSTGFVVNQVSASNINVSAATYIYLAIT